MNKPDNPCPFDEAAQNFRDAARLVMTMPDGWETANRIMRELRRELMQEHSKNE